MKIIQSHCQFEILWDEMQRCNMNLRFIMDRQAEHRLRSHWPVIYGTHRAFCFPLPNFRDVKSIGSQKNVPMLRGVASSKKAGPRQKWEAFAVNVRVRWTTGKSRRLVISFRCKWRTAKNMTGFPSLCRPELRFSNWTWAIWWLLPCLRRFLSLFKCFASASQVLWDLCHVSSCCKVTLVTAIIPVVPLPPAFSFSSFQHWGAKYLNGAKKHPVATVWPLGDLLCVVHTAKFGELIVEAPISLMDTISDWGDSGDRDQ